MPRGNKIADKLRVKIKYYKKKLDRFLDLVEHVKIDNTAEGQRDVQDALELAQKNFDKWQELYVELHADLDSDEESESFEYEERVNKSIQHVKRWSESQSVGPQRLFTASAPNNDARDSNVIQNAVRLPTIDLPRFHGQIEKWVEYRDLFRSLIHTNDALSPIQKFYYMKASLGGDAADLISTLDMSDQNYAVAYQMLENRFNNNKLLVHSHMKAIFNMSKLQHGTAAELRRLSDVMSKNLYALKQFNLPVEQWDTVVIFSIGQKLDEATLTEWEKVKKNNEVFPSLEEFKTFLNNRADLLEAIKINTKGRENYERRTGVVKAFVTENKSCAVCSADGHTIQQCTVFKKLSVNERVEKCKEQRLCLNCLKPGHFSRECRQQPCKLCNRKHAIMLHKTYMPRKENEENLPGTSSRVEAVAVKPENIGNITSASCRYENKMLLSTAIIKITAANGRSCNARCLLDSASQTHIMTKDLANKLNLNLEKVNLQITGISQALKPVQYQGTAYISSLNTDYNRQAKFLIMDKITNQLPNTLIQIENWNLPTGVQLADENFNKVGDIDVLLGSEMFFEILMGNKIALGRKRPILMETKLGWIIGGRLPEVERNGELLCNVVVDDNKPNFDDINKFWEMEEIKNIGTAQLTQEEEECESHFKKYTRRDVSGRFVVKLPFKLPLSSLGDSRGIAQKRYLSLEKKLDAAPTLKKYYNDSIKESMALGHIREARNLKSKYQYFIPYFAIIKENNLTTKTRLVYDASTPSTTGISLNHAQMNGPAIQRGLFEILIEFRTFKIALSADIKAMYKQVKVYEEDCSLQKMLWRPDVHSELKEYEMTTLVFGQKAAPYVACKCLQTIAEEIKNTEPSISKVILKNMYLDDLLCGAADQQEASNIAERVTQSLKSGGFEMRKWRSNDEQVLGNLSSKLGEEELNVLKLTHDTKTLGLLWKSQQDTFGFTVCVPETMLCTKRAILSAIAKIWDPLGVLSPCLMLIKIMMQRIWQEGTKWDEEPSITIKNTWTEFVKELPCLNKLSIPRYLNTEVGAFIEMHGFSDASKVGYGACIYIRVVKDSKITTLLFAAKGKVAPIKTTTVPKLELSGAVILVRLMKKVIENVTIKINKIYLWTDSTTVLSWLKMPTYRLQPFVSSRVTEIVAETAKEHIQWRYVPTKENPADALSRGVSPAKIQNLSIWWHGPEFLNQDAAEWPNKQILDTDIGIKKSVQAYYSDVVVINEFIDVTRFSEINKLIRAVAYVKRFIQNCKQNNERETGPIKVKELQIAHTLIIKLTQNQSFRQEILSLKGKRELSQGSKIICLAPFLDDDGVLRVGGRLKNAKCNYSKKFPILLDHHHHVTKLIIRNVHVQSAHSGAQLTLAMTRLNYWPTNGKSICKQICFQCIRCFKVKPQQTYRPIMGNLPPERLEGLYPFINTTVDFCGPFSVKNKEGRGAKLEKYYVAVFVCMSSKAIHLEGVSDLSTPAFLLSLQRFIGRRGLPKVLWSDNGLNFVGAANEIKGVKEFLKVNESKIAENLAIKGIKFKFLPPRAPHMGGLHEAGVKSFKTCFKKVCGTSHLTVEKFNTLLCSLEAVLNSRPLCSLSQDPNDLEALTPSHLLIGRTFFTLPEEDLSMRNTMRLTQYQRILQMRQHVWQRWSTEYITELQQRNKWRSTRGQLEKDDLVLVKEEGLPPLKWKLARVVELHPGNDGVVRVVTIRLPSGHLWKRPATKLCQLPVLQGGQDVQQNP